MRLAIGRFYTLFKLYLFIGISFTMVGVATAKEQWPQEKSLWLDYNNSNTATLKIENLDKLASYYSRVLGDNNTVDTLVNTSLKIAKKSNTDALLLKSYDTFFSYKLRASTLDLANSYLEEVFSMGRDAEWYYRLFQSKTYNKEYNFKAGAQVAKFSIDLAKTQDQKIRSLLQAGINTSWADDNLGGLTFFLEAQELLDHSSNDQLKIQVYSSIQQLYDYNKNNERAFFYCEKLLQVITESEIIDTAAWLEAKNRYLMLRADSALIVGSIEKEALEALEIAQRNGYLQVSKDYWSFLRSRYISNNNIKRLYELYSEIYPEEFANLKINDKEKFYRVSAYFAEYKGEIDSAKYFWNLSLDYSKDTSELYTRAHLTRRYAEFLFRIDAIDEAFEMATKALTLSKQSKFENFVIQSISLLIAIEEKRGNYKIANELLKQEDSLKILQILNSRESNLAVLGLKNEFKQLEIQRENDREKEQFRTRVNYIALISGLFIFIVVSYIIFRQYRQTRFEKGKSDSLLLNILPKQTAEELKATGTTKARRFNNVTVLFCDIVGFTKVAEKLSPEDLVKEIDTYFRVFDDIIQMYGLEKIKTVGDAYVAVGGMPQYNSASAKDVTHTAIKIMETMDRMKRDRESRNMPAFNLRIGINTGSVVAGVVGSIKFQYDIWGDAVNIAARMEQNSEPGRINISKNTYLEVRTSFNCSYRGKILAKNKGEIEMYFVETA